MTSTTNTTATPPRFLVGITEKMPFPVSTGLTSATEADAADPAGPHLIVRHLSARQSRELGQIFERAAQAAKEGNGLEAELAQESAIKLLVVSLVGFPSGVDGKPATPMQLHDLLTSEQIWEVLTAIPTFLRVAASAREQGLRVVPAPADAPKDPAAVGH